MPASRIVCLFLALSALTCAVRGEESVVGSVKTAQGGAVVHRGADSIAVREGMHLLLNDVLETSVDGRVAAILQDGTRISLGPKTELKVDQFVYQPVEGKFALVLRLGRACWRTFPARSPNSRLDPSASRRRWASSGSGNQFAVSLEGS